MKERRGRPLSPSPLVEKYNEIEDSPEKARAFINEVIAGDWIQYSEKTGRQLHAGWVRTFREMNRMRREFPDVWIEIFGDYE